MKLVNAIRSQQLLFATISSIARSIYLAANLKPELVHVRLLFQGALDEFYHCCLLYKVVTVDADLWSQIM